MYKELLDELWSLCQENEKIHKRIEETLESHRNRALCLADGDPRALEIIRAGVEGVEVCLQAISTAAFANSALAAYALRGRISPIERLRPLVVRQTMWASKLGDLELRLDAMFDDVPCPPLRGRGRDAVTRLEALSARLRPLMDSASSELATARTLVDEYTDATIHLLGDASECKRICNDLASINMHVNEVARQSLTRMWGINRVRDEAIQRLEEGKLTEDWCNAAVTALTVSQAN